MTRWLGMIVAAALAAGSPVLAHPVDEHGRHVGHPVDPSKLRAWTNAKTGEVVRGAFLAARSVDGVMSVSIERENGDVVVFALDDLSEADQQEARKKIDEVKAINEKLATGAATPNGADKQDAGRPLQAATFDMFGPWVKTRWDDRWLYVESDGLPHAPNAHNAGETAYPLMVGIKSWQQQVPLPQDYTGDNAWRIPLKPELADQPISGKTALYRGAIALAANGVPIFNALNNRGDDTYEVGELDEYGGHSGRGDDYHYHIAPLAIQKIVGKDRPIAYALDGFPLYGLFDPAAKPGAERACPLGGTEKLDELNGHFGAAPKGSPAGTKGLYHYHASLNYPYINGGVRGKVTVKDDQIDPQPRANPVRQWLQPLKGAAITGFKTLAERSWSLEYTLAGRKHLVNYRIEGSGRSANYIFEFIDPDGAKKAETYQSRPPRDERPPRDQSGRDQPPRDRPGREGTGGGRRNQSPASNDAEPPPAPPASPNAPKGNSSARAAQWVTPVVSAPRVSFHVFESASAGTKVSYHLYTPAAYERESERRFPLVLWLHGSGGGLPGIRSVSAAFDAAIEAGKVPACLVVFVNGLSEGMYVDWKDGSTPVESVIVKDLVPHIDASYRTIAAREGRVLDGFSMGGYGAARLGFKYPEMFRGLSLMGAGPLQAELIQAPRAGRQRAAEVLARVYGGDQEYFVSVSPRRLAEQHAGEIAAGSLVRMVIGDRDETFAENTAFHEHLERLKIPHQWRVLAGVAHDPTKVLEALGDANWEFYREAFGAASAHQEHQAPALSTKSGFAISSPDVMDGRLSKECSCDGAGRAPGLAWSEPPTGCRSLAVVMHHVSPEGGAHVYMVVANIPPSTRELRSGDAKVGTWGRNTVNRRNEYAPPCSKGPGDKAYTVTLYALSAEVKIDGALTRESLLESIADKTLAAATLELTYARAGSAGTGR